MYGVIISHKYIIYWSSPSATWGVADIATEPTVKKLRIDDSVKSAEQEAKILNKQLGQKGHSKNIFPLDLG